MHPRENYITSSSEKQHRNQKTNFSRYSKYVKPLLVIDIILVQFFLTPSHAQSVGFQPNLNLGFNPYLSPVFGYGLGLPFGVNGFSFLKNPLMANSLLGGDQYGLNTNIASKLHLKSFWKKYAPISVGLYPGGIKNQLNLLKHPEYSFTPYGINYGFGKHYGTAMVPNNPYKSPYGDYYNNELSGVKPINAPSQHSLHEPTIQAQASENMAVFKKHAMIKPLIKAGALLATAAVLGKKTFEHPYKLNPSGMIIDYSS